ncbi:RNA polymerase, sigma-24 subunit, ECF subfamily [Lysobacter dokdonensis DS-58]|uniref:RNA polymerase, sigma-24 subunit, ECF subfamily n=1 Tax=Lysobacter dokdonensis DS-58 TaxID=1300345 RepID=A0A0A2WPF6_9GAMM|nr:RNA polymerase sigma factor [Lysobacter dokdonensis]KGQ20150.1 RNA polymerase, sigma-24 subunit, ECF subfamily [Lysobacter dokdonensis DS-58]
MRADGFASFYAEHHAKLWAYLVRMGASHALASDLTQETFVRWLERNDAAFEGNARAYLYRVALNLYFDHARRGKREVAWDAVTDVAAATPGDAEIPQHVWRRLTTRERQLLWLSYAEGFTHDEIASITHLAAGSIRVLLSRARARFKTLQEEHDHA